MTDLETVKTNLRAKLIEATGYRKFTAAEQAVFDAISIACTEDEAEAVFADYLRKRGDG